MSTTLYAYLGNTPITFGAYGSNTTTITSASTWTRPSDWLTMPDTSSMTGSVGSFIGLLAVPTGSGNFVALSATNAYTVNWGDGTSASYAANATSQYQYNYDTLPSSSYSSGSNGAGGAAAIGYRQVLITVVPSGSGVNFTGINLQKKHSQGGLPSVPDVNWLDIAVGGSNITSINNIGGTTVSLRYLERCNVVNISSSIPTFSNMFNYCNSLQSVPLFNTANGTNFSSMFNFCNSLQSIPAFNVTNTAATASGTFTTMFNQVCYNLQIGTLSGSRSTIDYTGCLLSYPAIIDIFNNLGITGSVACSITCSGNWGSASLSAGDIAIATNKGWTVKP